MIIFKWNLSYCGMRSALVSSIWGEGIVGWMVRCISRPTALLLTSASRLCYVGLVLRSGVCGWCTREDAEESSNGLLSGTDSMLAWWTWHPESKFCLEADSRISIQDITHTPPHFVELVRFFTVVTKICDWTQSLSGETDGNCENPEPDGLSPGWIQPVCVKYSSATWEVVCQMWRNPVVTSAYGLASSQAVRFWFGCS